MRITAQKNGSLNEKERLEIAALLIKAGYVVKINKKKQSTGAKTDTWGVDFEPQTNPEQDECL